MGFWRGKNKLSINNSRINIVIAIVFLLGGSIIYRLYYLQIENQDLYAALALGQHQSASKLYPERGIIYASDYKAGKNGQGVYPIATNKDFALVYAIPKEIAAGEAIAEKLYFVFDEERIKAEVDEQLKKEEDDKIEEEINFIASLGLSSEEASLKENETRERYRLKRLTKEYGEYLKAKKEAEIELKKNKIVSDYLIILSKKNDPYEPLKPKVDDETLLDLYAQIAGIENNSIKKEELELKEGKIYALDDQGGKKELVLPGIAHTMVSQRYYPEKNISSHILGFASDLSGEVRGKYGLEGFFDEELFGQYGSIKTERGADRNIIILNDREYNKPLNGFDLILTIDRSIQFTACQKLNAAAQSHGADNGSLIIMRPETGEVLAMCSWPDYDPNIYEEVEGIKVFNNPAIFDQYEPGSVFKAITMAAAIDSGGVTPETTYIDEGQVMVKGWPRPIKNSDFDTVGGHGEANMNTVLELSLNTGAIFAMRQIGPNKFTEYVKNFGFGEKTGIELETESPGDIDNLLSNNVQEIYAATASFGQGITATALQMITAFNAIANGGVLMKPYIVKKIIKSDGTSELTQPEEVKRVISERSATLLSGMLVNVVESGHAKKAAVAGYYVGGKTGTAQVASGDRKGYSGKTMHTFIGFAPADEPKFVMLIKLEDPKDVSFAASSAAPLFGEIADFLLQYLEVPKGRK